MKRDLSPAPPGLHGDARRAAFVLLALAFGGASVLVPGPRGAHAQGTPPPAAAPQPVATSGQEDLLSQAQLEQLLAPIALFPDDLLMQMLMASTYPLEVVQAKRWLAQGQNAALRGDALAQALVAQSWDPSVKSLVPFPDVLTMMNDQLNWTQQVGDAVLGQQEDVLNAIQVLRGRAQANGALASGAQQTVNVTQNVNVAPAAGAVVAPPPQIITIVPTQPEVVYVPAYDPNVVFGTWPHAGYPPTFFPPPVGWGIGNALLTGMAFAAGTAIVGSLWGWGSPNWGRGSINVNANRYNNINVNRTQISGNSWRHDTTHRQGVAYRNDSVRNSVGATRPGAGGADRAAARDQFRGRVDQAQRGEGIGNRPGAGDRPGLGDRGPGGDRPGLGDRGPGDRPGAGDRPGLGDRGPGGDRPGLGDRGPGAGADRPGLGDRGPGDRPGAGDRPSLGDRAPGNRPATADRAPPARPGGAQQRPAGGQALADRAPAAAAQRPAVQHTAAGRPQPQARPAQARPAPQGLQGVGSGAQERAAANRGAASRQGQPAARAQAQQRAAARPSGGGGGAARAHAGGGGGGRAHGGGGGGGRGGGGRR